MVTEVEEPALMDCGLSKQSVNLRGEALAFPLSSGLDEKENDVK